MRLINKLRSRFRRLPESIRFDDLGVVRTMTNGVTESVRWADLEKVSVATTDAGPWSDDVVWLLEGSTGGCAVPQSAVGADDLLARLQGLPGFDNETFVAAMGCTDNAIFVCWQRAS